jgi:hypothetical protein
MKLIVTIDTEEDNWASYSTTDNPVENIERIIPLQKLFDEFGVMPTYLISYPVATNLKSVTILKRILEEGKCEIGMHCHPWNTPPFNENKEICEYDTMLCNLPEELQYLKLKFLHEVICNNFGIVPVSFRAGRWGGGPAAARSISRLGYRVDSSVLSYVNWESYHGPDFSSCGPEPFRFYPDDILYKDNKGSLLQVPATVGFLQKNFKVCEWLMKKADTRNCRKFHLTGILSRIGLLNKVWLCPEFADTESMISLTRRMQENNYPCLNMHFHSTSLLAGLSPFVSTVKAEEQFLQKIRVFLRYTRAAGIEPLTLAHFEGIFTG